DGEALIELGGFTLKIVPRRYYGGQTEHVRRCIEQRMEVRAGQRNGPGDGAHQDEQETIRGVSCLPLFRIGEVGIGRSNAGLARGGSARKESEGGRTVRCQHRGIGQGGNTSGGANRRLEAVPVSVRNAAGGWDLLQTDSTEFQLRLLGDATDGTDRQVVGRVAFAKQ